MVCFTYYLYMQHYISWCGIIRHMLCPFHGCVSSWWKSCHAPLSYTPELKAMWLYTFDSGVFTEFEHSLINIGLCRSSSDLITSTPCLTIRMFWWGLFGVHWSGATKPENIIVTRYTFPMFHAPCHDTDGSIFNCSYLRIIMMKVQTKFLTSSATHSSLHGICNQKFTDTEWYCSGYQGRE